MAGTLTMKDATMQDAPVAKAAPLASYALFAAMLASAGLPIYIHAPKFYAETYGISLGALGAVLFALRLFDWVQDPALGWLAARLGRRMRGAVALAGGAMAVAMLGLYAVTPALPPLWWFALTLAVLFSAYSFLTIAFYARGVGRAAAMGPGGHLRLAGWREGGSLVGVCLAAMAPAVLMPVSANPFGLFAAGFAVLVAAALWAMRGEWAGPATLTPGVGFRTVLSDPVTRRLLLIAVVNAAPLSVTSTLFLFFVESRLGAPGWEGPLLILFFLSAAAATPLWSTLARRFGERPVLLATMAGSILSFGVAATLSTGDVALFAAVCVASGAMVGADLVILPAAFARRLSVIAPGAAEGFGLWSFASKFTLAFAAVTLLPILDRAGFIAGGANSSAALTTLTALYALLPCALKLAAMAMLATATLPKE
jgi:GPH family glycoside/pentoside/hexuronide:cation symporter